jgi:hypothetical protein
VIGIHAPETAEEALTANLRREIGTLGITFAVVTDNSFVTWNAYSVQLWPTTFLIDRRGIVRSIHSGSIGLGRVEAKIKELLAEHF